MKTALVGQAAYGAKNRGHALLGASPAAGMAFDIINQMDIRGTPPPGVSWPAYWSGMPLDAVYVLARTAPDLDAERGGLVRTRALFIPHAATEQMESLAGAMEFLAGQFEAAGPYTDVELAIGDKRGGPHRGLVEALLAADGAVTVWPFAGGFEDALNGLWSNLWPEARRAFSFRLAFSPPDITEDPPTLITTMPGLVPRWAGFNLVKAASSGPADAAAALLLGDPASAALRDTMTGIDAALSTIGDLRRVVTVHDALTSDVETGELIAALRLLCHLSPNPKSGTSQKNKLVARLVAAMPIATEADIRMARNLDLSALAEPAGFWVAIRAWARQSLWAANAKAIGRVIKESLDDNGPVVEWREAIRSGSSQFLGTCEGKGTIIWSLLASETSLAEAILALAPDREKLQAELVTTLPRKIAAAAAEALLGAFARTGSMRLHAAVCGAAFTPLAAARRHLQQAPDDMEVAVALARASDGDYVAAALANDSDRLYSLAAAKAAKTPGLLAALDISAEPWRRLWREALSIQPGCWNGPHDPRAAMDDLLTASLDGTLRDDRLLVALAQTPLANVVDHPRRPELWSGIAKQAVELLLAATVDTWTAGLENDLERSRPEAEMASVLLEPARVRHMLDRLRDIPAHGIRAFFLFPELDERTFLSWVGRVLGANRSLPRDAAERFGRLVAVRSWRESAKLLGDAVLDGREDLRPAMEYCVDQVNLFTRYRLDMLSTASAKWRTLEEIGVDLYPIGPGDKWLWERAGGKDGDIPRAPTGRDAWHIVVTDLENGRAKVSVHSLIKAMAEEFPGNPTLGKMRNDRFFR